MLIPDVLALPLAEAIADNKVALVTVKKYRKEVLENGISNQ